MAKVCKHTLHAILAVEPIENVCSAFALEALLIAETCAVIARGVVY